MARHSMRLLESIITNRAVLATFLIFFGMIAVIMYTMWEIYRPHPEFETFATQTATCPADSTWFVDSVGNAGCCNGIVNPTTRKCSGSLVCSFAATAQLPQGVESCSAVLGQEHAKSVAAVCPPSLPYMIGPADKPTGCCGVNTSGDDTCPAAAPQCSMFSPQSGSAGSTGSAGEGTWWNGPAKQGEKMGCVEQRFHETLTCPTNYTLSGPTWQPDYDRNVSMCTSVKNMTTCFPAAQFDVLVSAGVLRAADAGKLRCPTA